MTNWDALITQEMKKHGETMADAVSTTLNDFRLNVHFDASFGFVQGEPFTLWTANRVYFPIQYDGAEWCGSVARNPDGKPTEHQGG